MISSGCFEEPAIVPSADDPSTSTGRTSTSTSTSDSDGTSSGTGGLDDPSGRGPDDGAPTSADETTTEVDPTDGETTGPRCGDGVVDPGETCDPIDDCPVRCEDDTPCTVVTLVGNARECTASCERSPIAECRDDDACCPDGCTGNDSDCASSCESVVSCRSDGCCPTSCHEGNDPDCDPRCGDGFVGADETCDDGNDVRFDGCDPDCEPSTLAGGWSGSTVGVVDLPFAFFVTDGVPTIPLVVPEWPCGLSRGVADFRPALTVDGTGTWQGTSSFAPIQDPRPDQLVRFVVRGTFTSRTTAEGTIEVDDPDCAVPLTLDWQAARTSTCGNGIVETPEDCDDGNTIEDRTCPAFCGRPFRLWACDRSFFGTNDGCDCGCGIVDPDCASPTSACDFCGLDFDPALSGCSVVSCDGDAPLSDIDPEDNALCVPRDIPPAWTCDPDRFATGAILDCDCGCGIVDLDCESANINACDLACDLEGSCAQGRCNEAGQGILAGNNARCRPAQGG